LTRFNTAGPQGLVTGRAPGSRPLLNAEQRQALQHILDAGPIPAVHGVVRWRLVDLIAWVWEEFRITISKQTLSRELRTLGYRKLSARPRHHAKNDAAVAVFKNVWPAPSASGFKRGDLTGLRQRIRSRGCAPAKMEFRAPWSS
jgi:transposase